jgi:hypothetical protein
MSNVVVDTESPEVSASASEAGVVEEAVQTPITDEVQVQETEEAVEAAPEAIPDKFAGKSAEEIINSYQNLEKELGRKSQEVGELRKLSDSFLQAEVSRQQQPNPPTETSETLEDTGPDFFDDPNAAVNQAIENHPKFQEFQKFQQEQAQSASKAQLEQSHPDFTDVVQDAKFQEWVKGSPIRVQLFQAADAYNFDAANELLSTWKDRAMIDKTQEVTQQAEAERKAALKAGTAESRTSTGSTGGGKTFNRADLIRLKMEDPAKYDSMQKEIFAAYADGRVT